MGAYFPASVVWYAFWSRGRRGVLLLLGLYGLLIVPWACSMVVWTVLHARG